MSNAIARPRRLFAVVVVLASVASSVWAQSVSATFVDPDGRFDDYYSLVEGGLDGALATWAGYLSIHPDAVIDIQVEFSDEDTARGGARGYSFLRSENGVNVWEPHVANEIRTGIEERPGEPDGVITIGLNYLTREFWYDPDPINRTAEVPSSKIDAVSTLAHEMGHVFGFNGWHESDAHDDTASEFDMLVQGPDDLDVLYFHGPASMAAYGGPVPLTQGSSRHYGNGAGLPGHDLVHGLMNGVGNRGGRRWPGVIDFAFLDDLGYETLLISYLEGDFNGDSVVDAADFTVWKDNFGASGRRLAGDGNLDRIVDDADYEVWLENFGRELADGGNLVPLPEPEGIVPLLLVFFLSFARRRQGSRDAECGLR